MIRSTRLFTSNRAANKRRTSAIGEGVEEENLVLLPHWWSLACSGKKKKDLWFMVVWLSLICLNAKDFINSQLYNSRLLFLQYFNWNCFTCNNKRIESIFIIWLNRRSGKMKRIMCFDRLTERARRAHLAPARDFPLWSRKKSSLFDQMHDKLFIDQAWLVKLASFFFLLFY